MPMPQATTPIRVVDLAPEHEPLYFVCLEDWPGADMAEAGDHKARWYRRARPLGLRVKLALDGDGTVAGMIQYLPIEHAPALGHDLHFILCVWVHGHPEGRGDRRGHGLGSALLEAAEADARALGSKGMAAWGLALPIWMRASWFRHHGYRKADRRGLSALVWKPFSPDAVAPRWLAETGKRPDPRPGKVAVTACLSGWCPAQNLAFERARRGGGPARGEGRGAPGRHQRPRHPGSLGSVRRALRRRPAGPDRAAAVAAEAGAPDREARGAPAHQLRSAFRVWMATGSDEPCRS